MVKTSTIILAAVGIGFALFVHAGGVDILRKLRAGEHMYPASSNYAKSYYIHPAYRYQGGY